MTNVPSLRARPAVRAAVLLFAVAFALGGCSTVKGWFGGKKKDEPLAPAALVEFAPSATVTRLWTADAGKGEGRLGARQGPAIADGRVYAAAVHGGVHAFDLQTGKEIWRYESKLPLSGGPGVGDGLVVAGSLEGDVVALDAATGAEKWKAKVTNEVIAAPTIGQGMVLVHSNDGRVTAFDAASGERRWFWNRDMPNLTVRGDSGVLLGPGYVFVGNADGTLTALSLADGRQVWDATVGEAEGRTELERMADVDGTPTLDGTTLFASSYKRQTVAVEGPSGRVLWQHDAGGSGRVAVAGDRVIVSDPAGVVWTLDKNSGGAFWQQDKLKNRGVTAPAVQGDYAVVGDADGYLHWLKLDTGDFAARTRVGHDALRATPVVADGVLVAQDVDGDLSAWRLGR
ncbi:MAG: outer membrane protein assembly factor BamB [Lysobacter sp.]|nr:outer membrane protein assembly factor BamB [Lysobacter sp.]